MLIPITNDPRPYAWGSKTAIAEFLGRPASGGPEAEVWLGAHSGSPARILHPQSLGGYEDLHAWIKAEPAVALGPDLAPSGRLPFLLKVLAAGSPLSLQAHPTMAQAAAGYERENLAGLAPDAPNRNYKDGYHKPELIVALSERFDALCGFRPLSEVRNIIGELRRLDATDHQPDPALIDLLAARLDSPEPLRAAVEWLLGGGDLVASLVAHVTRLAQRHVVADIEESVSSALTTVRELVHEYPGDPGIVVALLVQRVTLSRGEALYLPAGNIHAYLHGLGIELMAASDNVLRGGLTTKHIDVPELLEVLDFSPLPVPYLHAEEPMPGVRIFRPAVKDFALVQIELSESGVELTVDGPAIALSASGWVEFAGRHGAQTVAWGESAYVTPDEGVLTLRGSGEVFVATTGSTALTVSEARDSHRKSAA